MVAYTFQMKTNGSAITSFVFNKTRRNYIKFTPKKNLKLILELKALSLYNIYGRSQA